MMKLHPEKIVWGLRALVYKVFFKKFGLPSYIGAPTFLEGTNRISIGSRVRIFPGLRMEAIGKGTIILEDNIAIGQNLHCTSKGNLIIGSNTTILGNVMITNIDHNYKEIGVHILDQEHIVSETRIGPNCFIGYGAIIQAGTILGKQCIVGANSVVRGHFPDYCVIVGSPAKIVKRYDLEKKEWVRV